MLSGNKTVDIGFADLCMSYEWKCYQNDHIFLLQPKAKWGNFKAEIAEFAKDIIEQEVSLLVILYALFNNLKRKKFY